MSDYTISNSSKDHGHFMLNISCYPRHRVIISTLYQYSDEMNRHEFLNTRPMQIIQRFYMRTRVYPRKKISGHRDINCPISNPTLQMQPANHTIYLYTKTILQTNTFLIVIIITSI